MASFNDDYLCNDQQEQTFKSLCLVTSTGTVIKRLADVKGNELHAFIEDTTRPRKFDNRGLLYHNGKFPVGFGIIEWTVAPDRKDSSNDWVPQALMRKAQETPIYIATNYIVTKKQGVNAIIKRLKEVGIKVKAQGEINVLFAYYDIRYY
ncbi:MAG: hypothetical protein IKU86_13645 [Thermoguttaceae bacterium]|nr:hypothetical protein [Thermoguttaceae bacterium]